MNIWRVVVESCLFLVSLPCAPLESRLLYFHIQHLTSRKVVLLIIFWDNFWHVFSGLANGFNWFKYSTLYLLFQLPWLWFLLVILSRYLKCGHIRWEFRISFHRFQANWAQRLISPKSGTENFPALPSSNYEDRNNDCFNFRSICWFFCKITRMAKFVLADIIYGLTKVAFVLGYSHIAQPQCEYQYDKYLRIMKSFNTFGIFVYVW